MSDFIKTSDQFKYFDGFAIHTPMISLEIPKNISSVHHFNHRGELIEKYDCKNCWRFMLNLPTVDANVFALLVREVFDVPGQDNYLVNIIISGDVSFDILNLFKTTSNWDDLIHPWHKFTRYTYGYQEGNLTFCRAPNATCPCSTNG